MANILFYHLEVLVLKQFTSYSPNPLPNPSTGQRAWSPRTRYESIRFSRVVVVRIPRWRMGWHIRMYHIIIPCLIDYISTVLHELLAILKLLRCLLSAVEIDSDIRTCCPCDTSVGPLIAGARLPDAQSSLFADFDPVRVLRLWLNLGFPRELGSFEVGDRADDPYSGSGYDSSPSADNHADLSLRLQLDIMGDILPYFRGGAFPGSRALGEAIAFFVRLLFNTYKVLGEVELAPRCEDVLTPHRARLDAMAAWRRTLKVEGILK